MPRLLLVGLLQGPIAWLGLAAAISLALQGYMGVQPAATIGVSLFAGACAWAALGLAINAVGRWRERRAIEGGIAGVAPADRRSTVAVGTLEPLGAALDAPFDGSPCLAYTYEVTFDRGSGRSRVFGTIVRGSALAPCSVVTATGAYRVLNVPDLDAAVPAIPREAQLERFQRYAARTTFTPGERGAEELSARWADADGAYRGDVRFGALDGDTSSWALRQQHVPVGSRVCVFGRYSAEHRGLVSPLGAPMRLVVGDPAQVATLLRSQATFRAGLSAVLGAAAAALVAAFATG